MCSVVDLRAFGWHAPVIVNDRHTTEAINALIIAINGLRYTLARSGQSDSVVTRCDLNAAEARLTDTILNHREGMDDLAAIVGRAKRISSKLKLLSGKLTQLDSTTDSTTAP